MVEQFTAQEDFSKVPEGQSSEKLANPAFTEITSKDIKEVFNQATSVAGQASESLLPQLSLVDKAIGDSPFPPKIIDVKEVPLTRTENLLLNGLKSALGSGDVKATQEMLKALVENPNSADRVLQALERQQESINRISTPSLNWERGQDNRGNDFIRLTLYINNTKPYSGHKSGETELTIGSDGRNSASHRPPEWQTPTAKPEWQPINPQAAMREFTPWERLVEIDERRGK